MKLLHLSHYQTYKDVFPVLSAVLVQVASRKVVKPDPGFTILDSNQLNVSLTLIAYLFRDFFFIMSGPLHDFPEVKEFFVLNTSVMVIVNCIKEFVCRNLPKTFGPMLHCLVFFDSFGIVLVKDLEYLVDEIFKFSRKSLCD